MARNWTLWRPPALVLLSLKPDRSSATAIRAANPDWHDPVTKSFYTGPLRDGVTRRLIA
jgi:nicotinate-nucleotide adenylyltransferase